MDIGRFAGEGEFRFWRDSDATQTCRVYFVPPERPFLPIPTAYMLGGMRDDRPRWRLAPGQVGDDDATFRCGWTVPLTWGKAGTHFCGSPRQWLEGSTQADPPLVWTDHGFSTCCEGIFSMGTSHSIARFGADGLSVVDSRMTDPGAGPIRSTAPLCIPYLCLALADVTDLPDVSEGFLYYSADGKVWQKLADGSVRQILRREDADALYLPASSPALADAVIPQWDSATGRFVGSPLNGAGPVVTSSVPMSVTDALFWQYAHPFWLARMAGTWPAAGQATMELFLIATGIPSRQSTAALRLDSAAAYWDVRSSGLGAGLPGFGVAGAAAPYLSADGWDVRGGLVYDVPSAADLAGVLGLGTMAAADAADYYTATEVDTILADYATSTDVATAISAAVPPGTVSMFGGTVVPAGYLACDGAAVSRSTYAALFGALGVVWGPGDGSTTFNVPDLRGRSPLASGSGPGLSARAVGATGGEETHALSATEGPAHTHNFLASGDSVRLQDITTSAGTVTFTPVAGTRIFFDSAATQSAGSGTAHNTLHPFAVVEFIIKT